MRIVGDADGAGIALDADPFVIFGKLHIAHEYPLSLGNSGV
jgi:hypothetical protein